MLEVLTRPSSRKSLSHKRTSPGLTLTPNDLDVREKLKDILRGSDISGTGYLLHLLHAFGGSRINDLIFVSGKSPQPRWNDSGVVCDIITVEAGLDQRLLNILANKDQIIQSIEPFVVSDITTDSKAYSLKSWVMSIIM